MIALLATRAGASMAALIAFGILWTTWLIQHDRKVIEHHEVRVEKQAEKKDARAQANRRAAGNTDAVRLLEKRGELRD